MMDHEDYHVVGRADEQIICSGSSLSVVYWSIRICLIIGTQRDKVKLIKCVIVKV